MRSNCECVSCFLHADSNDSPKQQEKRKIRYCTLNWWHRRKAGADDALLAHIHALTQWNTVNNNRFILIVKSHSVIYPSRRKKKREKKEKQQQQPNEGALPAVWQRWWCVRVPVSKIDNADLPTLDFTSTLLFGSVHFVMGSVCSHTASIAACDCTVFPNANWRQRWIDMRPIMRVVSCVKQSGAFEAAILSVCVCHRYGGMTTFCMALCVCCVY